MDAAHPTLRSPVEARWAPSCTQMVEVAGGWCMPAAFGEVEEELRMARQGVVLADDTPRGKFLLQGRAWGDHVRQLIEDVPAAVGTMVAAGGVEVSRLRPDLLYLGSTPQRVAAVHGALRAAAAAAPEPLTVTDVTHGRFELRLFGPAAATLLSRVCGLDFHPACFPDGRVAQTSVAKTHQLIVRADVRVDAGDLPAYRLIGGRSLGAYVWDTLMEAGRDLQVAPMGWQARAQLG